MFPFVCKLRFNKFVINVDSFRFSFAVEEGRYLLLSEQQIFNRTNKSENYYFAKTTNLFDLRDTRKGNSYRAKTVHRANHIHKIWKTLYDAMSGKSFNVCGKTFDDDESKQR